MSLSTHVALRHAAQICVLALGAGMASPGLAEDAMMHMDMPAAAPGTDPAALMAEKPFLDGNDAAMSRMMADMAVAPTGDVDKDFVAMMVPHHQGAVDMAKLYLLYGTNQKLKYLAQEIVITQQQEIEAMHLAVGEPLPPEAAAPTQPGN